MKQIFIAIAFIVLAKKTLYTFIVFPFRVNYRPKIGVFRTLRSKIEYFPFKIPQACYILLESKFQADFKYLNFHLFWKSGREILCFYCIFLCWVRAFCYMLHTKIHGQTLYLQKSHTPSYLGFYRPKFGLFLLAVRKSRNISWRDHLPQVYVFSLFSINHF